MKKFVSPVSLFLSHIGPKRWPIRLQGFKSNIYLQLSNESLLFDMLIPEIKS